MNKPVILIGNGCRGNPAWVDRLCSLGMPVLVTWQAIDLVAEDSPAFCGRPGVIGQRAANIILQKASTLLILGAKLDMETVGWNLKNFAPRAKKFIVDIDQAELDKLPDDWYKIRRDLTSSEDVEAEADPEWMAWCKALYVCFRPELDGCEGGEFVDPYWFVRVLSDVLPEGAVLVPGSSGMQSCSIMQAFKVKRGQRILLCNTSGSMGMEPMAIGAAISSGKPVAVVTGDGGFGLNIQELEVVRREHLPIHYFVFSNGGYGSVVMMQDARFRFRVGCDAASGFTVPEWRTLAQVFHFPYYYIGNNSGCDIIRTVLEQPEAAIVEVKSSLDFHYACKMGSTLQGNQFVLDPLEDMTPKIPDLKALMEWDNA